VTILGGTDLGDTDLGDTDLGDTDLGDTDAARDGGGDGRRGYGDGSLGPREPGGRVLVADDPVDLEFRLPRYLG
jgi:hypothetical protein